METFSSIRKKGDEGIVLFVEKSEKRKHVTLSKNIVRENLQWRFQTLKKVQLADTSQTLKKLFSRETFEQF